MEPPDEVLVWAERRQQARLDRDFSLADQLRTDAAEAGWLIVDGPTGFTLTPKPAFDVFATIKDALLGHLPKGSATCGVGLIIDGWPEDVRICINSLIEHTVADVIIDALDLGNVDGAGDIVHDLARQYPDRIREIHLAPTLAEVGWGSACAALLALDPAPTHAVMDLSSVLTGDALTPLIDALDEPGVVGAGWRGADVDTADWRSVHDAGPGEVDVLLGYLMVVDTAAARQSPPNPRAMFYRNADLEWSLALRAAGGRLVVPSGDLPVEQERHRGYHDSDPKYRERESKRNYDRLLQQFRGRTEVLHPR